MGSLGIILGSHKAAMNSIKAQLTRLACHWTRRLNPGHEPEERAPDQFFAENSKGEYDEYAQR